MTDAPFPKRVGRPRVHKDEEASRADAVARATAATRARRALRKDKTVSLSTDTLAQGERVIAGRGLDGWSHLVTVLLEDEIRRLDGEL